MKEKIETYIKSGKTKHQALNMASANKGKDLSCNCSGPFGENPSTNAGSLSKKKKL